MHQIKILFIVPNLSAGGAQRVVTFLSKNIDSSIFSVKLIVLGFKKATAFNLDNVNVSYLNKPGLLAAIPIIVKSIKKEQPHIVFSSISHINVILGFLALYFKKIKFVAREASVVSSRVAFSSFKERVFNSLIKISYQNFQKIVCQSNDMKNDFIENYQLSEEQLVLINNPITEIAPLDKREGILNIVKFVTVGRLTEIKGHLRILDSLSKITDFDFTYTIIGSGHLQHKIEEKVKNLNLGDKVFYIPFTSEVLAELKKHDYFLQGSYVEGFPNALLESCSVGTPVIAFNAPGGTKEIVENGVNGFLVEDEKEFVATIKNLQKLKSIHSPEIIANSVLNKFNATKILESYSALFRTLTK